MKTIQYIQFLQLTNKFSSFETYFFHLAPSSCFSDKITNFGNCRKLAMILVEKLV